MSVLYLILAILTAVIGYNIDKSIPWAFFNFFVWPLAWVKWLVLKQVNMTIIKQSFSGFFS
jgi:hypothetical protein